MARRRRRAQYHVYAQGGTHVRRRMLTASMALAGVLVMAAPASAAIDRPVASGR